MGPNINYRGNKILSLDHNMNKSFIFILSSDVVDVFTCEMFQLQRDYDVLTEKLGIV